MRCATCGVYACRSGEANKQPRDCPMTAEPLVYQKSLETYRKDLVTEKIALASAWTEAAGYCRWSRLEEIMEFSHRAGWRRLGLAFCIGLRQEAKLIHGVFQQNGFEVVSVTCKTGAVPKEELGLGQADKIRPGEFEPMCNPVAQAKLLNKAETHLNILVGLCVGHDTLFIKHSAAPITVLAVKDRVLAHNPLGAVYAAHYYNKKLAGHCPLEAERQLEQHND
ncbi:MAG: DUF1847 domain-containing protein [Bacillota bacterium]